MIFQFSKKNDNMIFSAAWNTMFTDYWKVLTYALFLSQKVDGKMIFTWSFWACHDIPGLGKYGFSCMQCVAVNVPSQHFNIGSTLFQRCDQRWNNVDPTLKMKQNPTSDFQRFTTLIEPQCATLKQRRNNVTQRQNNVAQRWYKVVSTLFQPSVDVS